MSRDNTMAVIDPAVAEQISVRHLAVVVFDSVSLGIMSFAFGVFDMAAAHGELSDLDVRVVSGEPDATLTGGGLACPVPYDLDAIRTADLVIVPNWRSPQESPPEPVLNALRTAHTNGARIVGLCSGAFVLASAGLLDGRSATTHWGLAGLLADMYPQVEVDAAALYVDDGDVLTAGGGAAGMDLGLHLIRSLCGADVATKLAKGMVLPPHRQGGQAQYIESPIPEFDDEDPVTETMAWALTKLDTNLPVDELAKRAHMSRRNYDRRFREITGTAPATWLTHQRVIRAQRLLESTVLPVDQIARYCGFTSAAALRPHFRKLLGVAPAAYRETFGLS
ncbi:transcriptional regulator GlxA family with amidase domain [Kibdelosporangium banguiense]|uniref:Transcriptional regulator GlxA family with amidase domain n=1 Tax=Kibdelosporangium banguiense TaxID=1365924 RepID=A0ABS4TQ46_9PSEU|nr:helix-turn-helix domain-containing protein [Kibdelosporangium banguiense]MBP2326530.1 transcriptional regulator GlxA family with amidase domain [Kibdelosporangium banguiense]